MKTTMRDKVCQLIGKYQFLEEDFRSKSFFQVLAVLRPVWPAGGSYKSEAAAIQVDPRKTAPAGKWCADSAAQASASSAKEARNNG